MSDRTSANTAESSNNDLRTSSPISQPASKLTRLAIWSHDHHVPFLVISIGMIVMLLWAGAFKMTARGAEGIIPLVSNSPLIWWHFKLFGPYIGADIIVASSVTGSVIVGSGAVRAIVFAPEAIVFVEWPEHAEDAFPPERVAHRVRLTHAGGDRRRIEVE